MKIIFGIVIACVLIVVACRAEKSPAKSETDDRARALLAKGAQIIDVRTPEEFELTHVRGATNVPLNELEKKIGQVAKTKDAPLLVHCQSGGRSAKATATLKRLGYTQVLDLGSLKHARSVVEGK